VNVVGKPDEGDLHVRFDEGALETGLGDGLRHRHEAKAVGNSYSPDLRQPRQCSTLLVVLCKTTRQAEKALQAVTACVEEDLGLALNPEKTRLTTFGQGFNFLGYAVSARTIRMGGKAEERFKMKIKALTRRSHNLDAEVVRQVNRVIRGTVRYFATAFTTCLGQFNELDRWIRMRIRCMKYKRIWKTDNRRLKRRHIRRRGFGLCREVYVRAR
jgi:RNA-directed DNA polymerase